MEAYREIIDANRLLSVMQIPDALQNGKVEVIVIPLSGNSPHVLKQERKLGFLKGKVKFSVVGDGKISE